MTTVLSAPNKTSLRSYISTDDFHQFFFTYTTKNLNGTYVGTLTRVTSDAANTPAGRILKETGRKIVPGANPGVSNYMISVYDSISLLSGFIDPNARVFQVYNTDKPNFLPLDSNTTVNRFGGAYGPSLVTGGNILQVGLDINGEVTPSYMGVIDNLSTISKFAELYQWHGDNNMYVETYDSNTNTGTYMSSDGRIVATNAIGYNRRTIDHQGGNVLSDVRSTSNAPTGTITLSGTGQSIVAYESLSFNYFNSTIGTNDYMAIQYGSGLSYPGYFNYSALCVAPSTAVVTVINNTGVTQYANDATLQFFILKTSDNVILGESC